MTFTELKTEIKDRLDITSTPGDTRVGRLINSVYREVTTELGMNLSRQTQVSKATTIGNRLVTFSNVEKLSRVWRADSSGNPFVLTPATVDELRKESVGTGDEPTRYAEFSHTSNSITIMLDATPESVFNVLADALVVVADLSGSNEPAFPESFHDIIISGVLWQEYKRKGDRQLAKDEKQTYDERLGELRLFIAKSNYLKIQQRNTKTPIAEALRAGGGGSGSLGSLNYTQTGLITFDRDPAAPFAVASGSAKVDNLDADLLDGLDSSAFIQGAGTVVDNAIVRFDGTGGSTLQQSGITIADGASGTLSGTNSGDVTLAGSPNYLTIAGQVITRGLINLASHVTGILPSANGGTGNGFFKVAGPTTSEKTLTFPDANATVLTDATAVTVPQGGTGRTSHTAYAVLCGGTTTTAAQQSIAGVGTSGQVLTSNGAGALPTFQDASGGSNPLDIVEGRLTLTSGTPVTSADVTAATTVYFALYKGNRIALYTGTVWSVETISELSVSVPATTATMYDVFVDYNGGTPQLQVTAWTNDTTRATALTKQDGVYVQTGNTDWRYVGSFRTTGVSGQTEDSLAKRYVWNYYNRVSRPMRVLEATSSWTYTTDTLRQANGAAANQLDIVCGVAEDEIAVQVIAASANSSNTIGRLVSVGQNSTSAHATGAIRSYTQGLASNILPMVASLNTIPAVGRSFFAWIEKSIASGTTTWYGNDTSYYQSGIFGTWRA